MRCNYESIARWNRHYYETARKADAALAEVIRERAAEIRAAGLSVDFEDYYRWVNSNPAARVHRQTVSDHHGTVVDGMIAWREVTAPAGTAED